MATIPSWLLGRHLTSVTLTGQTESFGSLSDDDSSTLTAIIEEVDFSVDPQLEEINSVNSTILNHVNTADDISCSFSVLLVNGNLDPDPLATLVNNYGIIKASFSRGTGYGDVFTVIGQRGNFRTGIKGRGKQIASLELKSVDAGADTYVRTVD